MKTLSFRIHLMLDSSGPSVNQSAKSAIKESAEAAGSVLNFLISP